MNDFMLSSPFGKLIAAPSTSFISPKAKWKSKVLNPAAFDGVDEMVRPFTHHQRCHLVLRGHVNHRKDGHLLLHYLDPHGISLTEQLLQTVCVAVHWPVKADLGGDSESTLHSGIPLQLPRQTCTTGFQRLTKGFWRRMTKIPM